MGFRKGLLFGLVAGSAIAVGLGRSKRVEAPGQAVATPEGAGPQPAVKTAPEDRGGLKDVIDKVKRHAEEALDSAHEAQAEEEARLRGEFEQAKRKSKGR